MVPLTRMTRALAARWWCRGPVALKSPLPAPLFSDAALFEALLDLGRRYRGGENQEWFRVISRGEVLADRAELTARPDDQTLDGYIERLGRTLAGTDYMVLVNEVQALSPSVFEATATLLTGLYGQIGMPAGGANLTLIAGDYRLTPFGLHKDEADILTFVVRGRKRLLLWPFEDLCGALGAPDASRAAPFVAPTDFDLSPWRSRAVVLEGTAGDVLAWPREWWHVAEDGADAPVTLALGLVRTADPLRFVARAASDRWRAGSGVERPFRTPRGGQYARSLLARPDAEARRALADPDNVHSGAVELLRFLTAAGLPEVPRPKPIAPLDDAATVCLAHDGALAWLPKQETQIDLCASGSVLTLSRHPRLLRLLRRLAAGDRITVSAALQRSLRPLGDAASGVSTRGGHAPWNPDGARLVRGAARRERLGTADTTAACAARSRKTRGRRGWRRRPARRRRRAARSASRCCRA